jgi:hypothetical protein
MTKKPYCKPHDAGLASETPAVCRRIGKILEALDNELTAFLVEGEILNDLRDFRYKISQGLEREGWTFSYDGGNRMKVRQPGHKRPFFNRTKAAIARGELEN